MTKEETREVLRVIRASYPHSFNKMSIDDKKNLLAVWTDMFAEDDVILVLTAVKSYIRTNPSQFAPSVGQIVEMMDKLSHPERIDADTAWSMVYKALSNSIYNAKSEFAKLPKEVQAGVGSPEQLRTWAVMNTDELQTVVASNFKRGYTGRVKDQKEFEKLPTQAKAIIQNLADMKKIGNH